MDIDRSAPRQFWSRLHAAVLILALFGVFVAVPLALALALGRARGRPRSRDPQARVMARLAEIQSPSGTSFFQSANDVVDLSEDIVDLRRPPDRPDLD